MSQQKTIKTMKKILLIFAVLFITTISYSQSYTTGKLKADTVKSRDGERLTIGAGDTTNIYGTFLINGSAISAGGGDANYYRDVKKYDATGDGSTDDWEDIQTAFDVGDGKIVIGQSIADTFIISQPIWVSGLDGLEVEINGVVKMQDGYSVDIASNSTATDEYIVIAHSDASKFSVGQWVSITSNDLTKTIWNTGATDTLGVQGGSDQTRREAVTLYIKSIDSIASGNTDTLNLSDDVAFPFAVADNVKVGHTQSCFIFADCNNLHIYGNGVIDQNKANQFDCEPVQYIAGVASGEEIRAGCAISTNRYLPTPASRNTGFKIGGVTLKNSLLHNLSIIHIDSVQINKIKGLSVHDKHIILVKNDNVRVSNSEFKYSEFEDGVQCYIGVTDFKINNCYFENISRTGIGFDDIPFSTVDGCEFNNVDNPMSIGSNQIIKNTKIKHGGGISIDNVYNVEFYNTTIDSILDGNYSIEISRACDNIIIDGGRISNTIGSGHVGAGLRVSGTSNGIYLSSIQFDSLKVAVSIADSPTDIKLKNCDFINNTSNGSGTGAADINYLSCTGLTNEMEFDDNGRVTMPTAKDGTTWAIGTMYINADSDASQGLQVSTTGRTSSSGGFYVPNGGYYYFDGSTSTNIRCNSTWIFTHGVSNADTRFYINDGGVSKAWLETDGITAKVRIGQDITVNESRTGADVEIIGTASVSDDLMIATKTPSSASDTGIAGTIAWDANYIYICTATNTWKRVAISTW